MKRGGSGPDQGRVIIVAATALLCLVIAIGVGLEGQFRFGGPIWTPPGVGPGTVALTTTTPKPVLKSSAPVVQHQPPVFGWAPILIVLSALALAVIVIFVILWLRHRPRRQPARYLSGIEVTLDDLDADPESPLDLPVLRRGLTRAEEILDSGREPRDAIVRAWIGLQEAAEDSGLTRRASETPTEFTTRVFQSVNADRAAAETLLALYLRVRFGTRPATQDDVAQARKAVAALGASWPVRNRG